MTQQLRTLRCYDSQHGDPGWTPGPPGVVLENPKFGARVHHVSWFDGDKFLYDQILLAQRPGGAVTIPVDTETGEIGLVQVQRPTVVDMDAYTRQWPKLDMTNLVRLLWEAPRGLPNPGESSDATAIRETEEEAQVRVIGVMALGLINPDTSFYPHLTYGYVASVDRNEPARHAPVELDGIRGKVHFFTLDQVNQLEDEGLLPCAMTGKILRIIERKLPEYLILN